MTSASALRRPEWQRQMPAFLNLGPWELVILLVALAVLLGGPVLAMAGIVWFMRTRRRGQARGKAKES